MNECCKETYKRTLKEVILLIEMKKPESIELLKKTLEHAVSLVNEIQEASR